MTTVELLGSEFTRWRLRDLPNYQPHEVQHAERVTVSDLCYISCQQLLGWGFKNWDGQNMLVPLWVLGLIKDNEELIDINRQVSIVGKDPIDDDTRQGLLAYGFNHPMLATYAQKDNVDVA